uniref:ArfGAP with GTPase domain, ankyrin repeat and PH domain 2 n=1 Tax=Neogobius melanostomus TaxID=47308 RepID=A0A8C6S8P4_9GOBI
VRMGSSGKSANSTAIKAEIKRHESLQSAINRLSKQFERVSDAQLRSGLKVYLHSLQVNIANSQEWTLSRAVPELRLGVLGSLKSGKSALVNKYITGSYAAVERPDGGRFKKEMLVDGQSHLLLIREEPGPPDAQFCSWVDAVILVFSLENEASFQDLYSLYSQLSSFRADLPVIVVGTQDKISSSNPRVIEDQRARQLCIDVRHSLFYETCATYGFNVDRVFSEAAQKIVAQRKLAALQACKSLPNSPSHSGGSTPGSASFPSQVNNNNLTALPRLHLLLPSTPVVSHRELRVAPADGGGSVSVRSKTSPGGPRSGSIFSGCCLVPDSFCFLMFSQSILYKRSGSSLNKEWKKKYVTLSNNGTLSYHSSVNSRGNGRSRCGPGRSLPVPPPSAAVASPVPPSTAPGVNGISKRPLTTPPVQVSQEVVSRRIRSAPYDSVWWHVVNDQHRGPFTVKDSNQSSPMSDRKKNRRKKSMNQKGDSAVGQAEENSDFIIVSFTGQTWHFEAQSLEERDSWVSAIESQILASLQSCESGRNKARRSSQSEAVALQAIRNAKGNGLCVDCEAPNPTWASLNLGALICIECSGIHRNLGTHLSRVRSLDLDDWPGELTQVLAAIGNHTANSIWESCTQGRAKPAPNATREERESWIRAKYEQRSLPEEGLPHWLLSAVTERDLPRLLLLLAHSNKEQINPPGPGVCRTALHAACSLGDVVMTQLLVWYGVNVKSKDEQSQTALMLARKNGSKGCMDILLQHGCSSETSPTTATPVLSRR